MANLLSTLREMDEGMFTALAQLWGITITNMKSKDIIEALQAAMLQPERAELVWDMLDDEERGALQLLIAGGMQMPTKKFERAFGEIRKMGKGAIEREQPHRNPISVAEGLYYRGFIGETFGQNKSGMQPIIYVPDDLVQALPVHKTAYVDIEDEANDIDAAVSELDEHELVAVQQASTALVDDLTSLLAFLRIHSAGVEAGEFLPAVSERLQPFLLIQNKIRLSFLLGIGLSADILTSQDGLAYPKRAGLQKWLTLPRFAQVKALAGAWQESTIYHDLWHVPGLHPDPDAGFPYDPRIARQALVEFLTQFVPATSWWSIDSFIETVKAVDPDFQRPGGDYESWYIRNDAGEYLRGFGSWDAVEGALLEFYLLGPMHWLGLVDIAQDAARLTAYGRAFLELIEWPQPPEPNENILVRDDGVLIASRKVSRLDRFQVARFTTWGDGGAPYHYRLDAAGIKQAEGQGINIGHIKTFLTRHLDGQALPPVIARLLDSWQGGTTASVSFEQLLVLRATSSETLDRIYDNPALRRYLGARLGPMAGVVLAGQEDALEQALGQMGMQVEILG